MFIFNILQFNSSISFLSSLMSAHLSAAQKAAVAAAAAVVRERAARRNAAAQRAEAAAAHEAAVYLGEHLLIEDPLFDDGYNAPTPVYPVDIKMMKREDLYIHSLTLSLPHSCVLYKMFSFKT